MLVREKNKWSEGSYISPDCPEDPRERIFTKFGIHVPLVEIIGRDKLLSICLRVSILQGSNLQFSHRKLTLTCAACDKIAYVKCFLAGRSK